jgi:bacterioferritin-associated ferredoxin
MSFDWQDISVAVICLASALYVARAVWKSLARRSTTGCGTGCSKCASQDAKAMLQIDAPRAPGRNSAQDASPQRLV